MLKPLEEVVCTCDCPQNMPTFHSDKLEPSLDIQNIYTPLCRQISDPLIRKLSQLELLDANTTLCGFSLNNLGRIPKSKLKPVFNETVHTPLDNMYRIQSEELKFRFQKLLNLRNEIYTGYDKTSKDRNASRTDSRNCSIALKHTESQHSSHFESISSNQKIVQLTSCSACSQKSLKGESSTLISSEQKDSLSNLGLSSGANNCKHLSGSVKKKRKLPKKNQHKIYNFKISNYAKNIYPGLSIGHKHCVDSAIIVPKHMGWLWNITDEVTGYQPHPTWRPGAVAKSVSKIIKNSILQMQTEVQEPFATQAKKKIRGQSFYDQQRESCGSEIASGHKTLLHLHEKRDVYCVNVHPAYKNYKNKKDPLNFKIKKCNDNEDVSSSDLSLEIDVIVPNKSGVKSEQVKENSKESQKHEEEIKKDTPTQKNVSCKKKKCISRQVPKQDKKK